MRPPAGTDVHLRSDGVCLAAKVTAEGTGMQVHLVAWEIDRTRFEHAVEHDQDNWQRDGTWHFRPGYNEGCLTAKDD